MDPSEFTASLRPTFSPTSPFSDLISDGRERELCFTHFFGDQTAEKNPSQNDLSKVAASKH